MYNDLKVSLHSCAEKTKKNKKPSPYCQDGKKKDLINSRRITVITPELGPPLYN